MLTQRVVHVNGSPVTRGRCNCSPGAGDPGGSVMVETSQASSSRLCGHKDHCAVLWTASGVPADGVLGYLRCCPVCLMGAFQRSLSVLTGRCPGPRATCSRHGASPQPSPFLASWSQAC